MKIMESTENELVALDYKIRPMLDLYCALVMFLCVLGSLFIYLFIINFLLMGQLG